MNGGKELNGLNGTVFFLILIEGQLYGVPVLIPGRDVNFCWIVAWSKRRATVLGFL